MDFVTLFIYALASGLSLFVGVLILILINGFRKPIRVTVLRKLSDNHYQVLKRFKFKNNKEDFTYQKKLYTIYKKDLDGKITRNEDIIQQGRKIFMSYEEGKPSPLSYTINREHDNSDFSSIADSHFLADLMHGIPKWYYLITGLACIVAIAGVFIAMYSINQTTIAQNNFNSLQTQYYELKGNFTMFYYWVQNTFNMTIPPTNGTWTIG